MPPADTTPATSAPPAPTPATAAAPAGPTPATALKNGAVPMRKGSQTVMVDMSSVSVWREKGYDCLSAAAVEQLEITNAAARKGIEDQRADERSIAQGDERIRKIVREELKAMGFGR